MARDELHIGVGVPKQAAVEINQWVHDQKWPEGTEIEDIEEYHITMLFLQGEGSSKHREDDWTHDRHAVTVKGIKEFPPSEEREGLHPIVLLVEGETLQGHHNELVDDAEDKGLEVGEYTRDKYTPHITIAYGPSLPDGVEPPTITFETEESSVSDAREEDEKVSSWRLAGREWICPECNRGEWDHGENADDPMYCPNCGSDENHNKEIAMYSQPRSDVYDTLNPAELPEGGLWHMAPTEDRARIHQHGLIPSHPKTSPKWQNIFGIEQQQEGVYGVPGEEQARAWGDPSDSDLWHIPAENIKEMRRDPLVDAFSVPHRVNPQLHTPAETHWNWQEKKIPDFEERLEQEHAAEEHPYYDPSERHGSAPYMDELLKFSKEASDSWRPKTAILGVWAQDEMDTKAANTNDTWDSGQEPWLITRQKQSSVPTVKPSSPLTSIESTNITKTISRNELPPSQHVGNVCRNVSESKTLSDGVGSSHTTPTAQTSVRSVENPDSQSWTLTTSTEALPESAENTKKRQELPFPHLTSTGNSPKKDFPQDSEFSVVTVTGLHGLSVKNASDSWRPKSLWPPGDSEGGGTTPDHGDTSYPYTPRDPQVRTDDECRCGTGDHCEVHNPWEPKGTEGDGSRSWRTVAHFEREPRPREELERLIDEYRAMGNAIPLRMTIKGLEDELNEHSIHTPQSDWHTDGGWSGIPQAFGRVARPVTEEFWNQKPRPLKFNTLYHGTGADRLDSIMQHGLGDMAERMKYGDSIQETQGLINGGNHIGYRGAIPPEAITPGRYQNGEWTPICSDCHKPGLHGLENGLCGNCQPPLEPKTGADEWDSREYQDSHMLAPNLPNEKSVAMEADGNYRGCTCDVDKLKCPIHGMNPQLEDPGMEWSVAQGSPVGWHEENYTKGTSAA